MLGSLFFQLIKYWKDLYAQWHSHNGFRRAKYDDCSDLEVLMNVSAYTTLIGFKYERDYKERLEMQDADEGAGVKGHLKIF